MKRQIRRGTFETNSSSVHSLTMCTEDEFKKWENGEVLFWGDYGKFATREEIINELMTKSWYRNTDWRNDDDVTSLLYDEGVKTFNEFFEDDWYETYNQEYTTPNGEKVIAFGYYGHD